MSGPGGDAALGNAELVFAGLDLVWSVRSFSVSEGISRLFEVLVTVGSAQADLDMDGFVGRGAAFRLATASGSQPFRIWSGLCSDMEQLSDGDGGVSLYQLRLVPQLWRTSQRVGRRIFQHVSAVDVADALLDEWGIKPLVRQDRELPRHAYRVQHGESDFTFLSRQLEAAGISYFFEQVDARGDGEQAGMQLVLATAPEKAPAREQRVAYIGSTEQVEARPWVRDVRLARAVRHGRVTLRGYDFRSSPELRLSAEARVESEPEQRYELYRYDPGAFVAEPASGDNAAAGMRVQEGLGSAASELELERARASSRALCFRSNVWELAAGTVFGLEGHPREQLCCDAALLVRSVSLEGEIGGEWHMQLEAVLTDRPYRPAASTPKPRVMGVQSAVVVGPEGEEIYTDEYGRVKVQFYWDREGQADEHSSCWIRVSQAWAGGGFGMSQIPRVGHEVLVGFFDGDPDRPVVIGRLHNRGNASPETLPQHKTKTVWRSCSTPGADGYNEISFEDAAGEELLRLRAQRNLDKIVLADEHASVGANLVTTVKADETRAVGGDQSLAVRGDRRVSVGRTLTTRADVGLQTQAGEKTGVYVEEGKLVLSNGSASIVLDGPHIHLNASANLRLSCGRLLALSGKQVDVDGNPDVFINTGEPTPPAVAMLPVAMHSGEAKLDHEPASPADRVRATREGGVERPEAIGEAELAARKLYEQLKKGQLVAAKLGVQIQLPEAVDEQLFRLGRITDKAGVVRTKLLDPETYEAMQERLERRLLAEKLRLQKLGKDLYVIFEGQRDHVTDLAKRLETRFEAEKENVSELKEELGAIFSGERGNLLESGKALVETVREQASQVMALRRDLVAMLEREKAYVERFVREWKGAAEQVKQYIGGIKDLIENPKDAILDIVFGQDKELAKDLVDLAEEFGLGDELADLLGVDSPGSVAEAAEKGSEWVSKLNRPTKVGLKHGGINLDKYTKLSKAAQAGGKAGGLDLGKYPKPSGLSKAAAGSGLKLDPTSKASAAAKKGAQVEGLEMTSKYSGSADGFAGGSGVSDVAKAGHEAGGYAMDGPTAVSRGGGMAAGDVASALEDGNLAFVQTPAEGQLMVIPSEGARALDQAALSSSMVDAQMAGKPVGDAVATSLQESGNTVYRREWGDWTGPFVQAAKQTASSSG